MSTSKNKFIFTRNVGEYKALTHISIHTFKLN